MTPPSPWTLTEPGLTNKEGEGDTNGIKVESLQWKKEEDHKTTSLQIVRLQQDHKEHALNVAKWDTLQGTALGNGGRQT